MLISKDKWGIRVYVCVRPEMMNYFEKIDTPEKAYWFGLLCADGHNKREGGFVIRLQTQDKTILEKMSLLFYGEIKLTYKPPYDLIILGNKTRSSGNYTFHTYGYKIRDDLLRLGMTHNKSLTLRFPSENQVSFRLINHFIRGFNDGDGCIGNGKEKAARYRVTIIAPEAFCQKIIDITKQMFGFTFSSRIQGKMTIITLFGNRQVKSFLDWIYKDASVYLDRKYEKYQELCKYIDKIGPKYSTHEGITYDKCCNRWIAKIKENNNIKYVGRGKTEEEAYQIQQTYIISKEKGSMLDGVNHENEKLLEPNLVQSAFSSI